MKIYIHICIHIPPLAPHIRTDLHVPALVRGPAHQQRVGDHAQRPDVHLFFFKKVFFKVKFVLAFIMTMFVCLFVLKSRGAEAAAAERTNNPRPPSPTHTHTRIHKIYTTNRPKKGLPGSYAPRRRARSSPPKSPGRCSWASRTWSSSAPPPWSRARPGPGRPPIYCIFFKKKIE